MILFGNAQLTLTAWLSLYNELNLSFVTLKKLNKSQMLMKTEFEQKCWKMLHNTTEGIKACKLAS